MHFINSYHAARQHRAQLRGLVTQVGVMSGRTLDHSHWAGLTVASVWPARSKPRVGSWVSCEGWRHMVPRVEDNAWGWFHRAAKTSRSWQWKDNGLLRHGSDMAQWVGPKRTITFLKFILIIFIFIKNKNRHLIGPVISFSYDAHV